MTNERSYRPPRRIRPAAPPPVEDLHAERFASALASIQRMRTDVLRAPVPMSVMWHALARVDAAEALVRDAGLELDSSTCREAVFRADDAVNWTWDWLSQRTARGAALPLVPDPLLWGDRSLN